MFIESVFVLIEDYIDFGLYFNLNWKCVYCIGLRKRKLKVRVNKVYLWFDYLYKNVDVGE